MALKVSAVYYAVVNVLLFIFMGIDKRRAIKDKWRIKEATLLTMGLIGGGIGGIMTAYRLLEKTFSSQNEEMVFLCGIRHRRHTAYSAFVDVR